MSDSNQGYTVLELLFVCSLACLLVGISVPGVKAVVERSRGAAAARYLAARMSHARARAVARSTMVALRFEESGQEYSFAVVEDGNADGVRTRDIDEGVDRQVTEPIRLSDLFPGASIGLSEGTPASEPVSIGSSTMLSFNPNGTSTSGSIYVLGPDGTQWAVRVLGVTGRTRTLRYVRSTGEWVNAD